MPCYKPIKAYRSLSRGESGRYGITFNPTKALIEGSAITLPCGGCIGCKIDRTREWATRCYHEAQMHEHNSYLTLTFSDEHLPADYGVHVRTWQLFNKRLRKHIAPIKTRFFACGEYSDPPKLRPHYHALIFGYQFPDLEFFTKNKNGNRIYISKSLDKIWGFGNCFIGSVTYQSAGYVARYVMKKQNGDDDPTVDHYTRVHPITGRISIVRREFCVQSRKPGLGASWYAKYASDAFPSDFVVIDGRKHSVPKFYTKKLEEEEAEKIKRRRKLESLPRRPDNTPERLKAREAVKAAQIAQLKRNLDK